jgi:hypothetical protein
MTIGLSPISQASFDWFEANPDWKRTKFPRGGSAIYREYVAYMWLAYQQNTMPEDRQYASSQDRPFRNYVNGITHYHRKPYGIVESQRGHGIAPPRQIGDPSAATWDVRSVIWQNNPERRENNYQSHLRYYESEHGRLYESEHGQLVRAEYEASEHGQLVRAEYYESEHCRLVRAEYDASEHGQLVRAEYHESKHGRVAY